MCDKVRLALFIGLIMLPLSGLMIHEHVHPDIEWVYWFVLFDAVVITALYIYPPTRTFAFWLNNVFGLAGIVYHAQYNLLGTLSDSMIIIADIMIGYVLYLHLLKNYGVVFRPKRTRPRTRKATKRKSTKRRKK